jgi:hypothetical protein
MKPRPKALQLDPSIRTDIVEAQTHIPHSIEEPTAIRVEEQVSAHAPKPKQNPKGLMQECRKSLNKSDM